MVKNNFKNIRLLCVPPYLPRIGSVSSFLDWCMGPLWPPFPHPQPIPSQSPRQSPALSHLQSSVLPTVDLKSFQQFIFDCMPASRNAQSFIYKSIGSNFEDSSKPGFMEPNSDRSTCDQSANWSIKRSTFDRLNYVWSIDRGVFRGGGIIGPCPLWPKIFFLH